jgi:hypothetical protein
MNDWLLDKMESLEREPLLELLRPLILRWN